MSYLLENSWSKTISTDLNKQMNEVRELKLLNVGMSINMRLNKNYNIQSKNRKYSQSDLLVSYLPMYF